MLIKKYKNIIYINGITQGSNMLSINNFFNNNITELSILELELWIYKATNIYKSKKVNKVELEYIKNSIEYIMENKKEYLAEPLLNILISLEDNIKYDLEIIC